MKGLDLIIKILLYIALILGVLMAVLNYKNSWSQLHFTAYDPLLNATLLSIVLTFYSASTKVKDRYKEITAIYFLKHRISYRLEHALRVTAFLFAGVLVFGVNNPSDLLGVTVHDLHFVFTGLAIVSGYLTLILHAETKKDRICSGILTAFGLTGFALGFLFNLYSVSWAEVLAALPMAVFIYKIS